MKKIITLILSVVFLALGGGTNCYAAETDTVPGELLAIQIRQEKQHQEDKLFASLSAFTIISEDKAMAQIHFYGAISSQVAVSLQNDLFVLENKTAIRNINIYLSSLGGEMFAGFAVIEIIKMAKKSGFTFTIYAMGTVGSMAIPIYAVCEPRIAYHSTVFMVHPSTLGTAKMMLTGADLQSQTDLYNMTQNQYVSVLAEYTNLSKEEWLEKIKTDTWFSADQAKEWGLVDEIR